MTTIRADLSAVRHSSNPPSQLNTTNQQKSGTKKSSVVAESDSDSKCSKFKLIMGGGIAILLMLIIVIVSSLNKKVDGTMSVTESTKGRAKRGELIFHDEFNNFDLDTWEHENTMSGGGNWEFQIYQNNRSNSYVKFGTLYIKPTLTSDKYGEAFLTSGKLEIGGPAESDQCTNALFNGCERQGTQTHPINPIMSARIRTLKSFAFKYGKVEVRAKLPAGDWLWPAIWLMPQKNQYGTWPASGEIDILESRGNLQLFNSAGVNIGVEQVSSTLHFGPYPQLNGWDKAHFETNSKADDGFNNDFHLYQLEWTPEHIKFSVDGTDIGTVNPSENFWKLGGFGSNIDNPWRYSDNVNMAPFDQKFYIVINLAVGGTNGFFPDNIARGQSKKPWRNDSPNVFLDFWKARHDWEPTWRDEDAAFQVDYIRVWAL